MQQDSEFAYAMLLSYRGSDFHGFQSQPTKNTIQDHLEASLKIILRQEVRVSGASRTDSGVHAEGQVCSFKSHISVDTKKLLRSLSAILPKDIVVMKIWQESANFHPIGSSVGKIYCYRVWLQDAVPPILQPFVWKVPWTIDLNEFRAQAEQCIGTHDFKAFCASDASVSSYERKVMETKVFVRGPLVEVWFHGEGFLKQMIRSLVGSMVDIASQKRDLPQIKAMIAGRDRLQVGQTAPAEGLSLVKVQYEPQTLQAYLDELQPLYSLPVHQVTSKNA